MRGGKAACCRGCPSYNVIGSWHDDNVTGTVVVGAMMASPGRWSRGEGSQKEVAHMERWQLFVWGGGCEEDTVLVMW